MRFYAMVAALLWTLACIEAALIVQRNVECNSTPDPFECREARR